MFSHACCSCIRYNKKLYNQAMLWYDMLLPIILWFFLRIKKSLQQTFIQMFRLATESRF